MATQKERDALSRLISAAIKVNASSERIDVTLEIDRSSVDVRICDPFMVGSTNWEWLFYAGTVAYFSNDTFTEEAFLARCQEFIDVVNGFEGHAAKDVA